MNAAIEQHTEGVLVECTDEAIKQFCYKVDDDYRSKQLSPTSIIIEDLGGLKLFVAANMADALHERIDAFLRSDVVGSSCEGPGLLTVPRNELGAGTGGKGRKRGRQ
eukprot:Rhum_TRINITY_DN7471_c0_g2::Rhum_TRINITY_DN7471_c0_g2_i1::g.23057::m.23057/K10845/TTDA, GTF2H5, TFB5; TFIIH basal transcription factor complex TTD-A subunit